MAKISARGDSEVARWRRDANSAPGTPYEMVLTARGRLLYKANRSARFMLRRRGVAAGQADAQAAMFRMPRA